MTTVLLTISIVVPALNEAAEIDECLATAREAGVREIIVVDGGSSDATVDLARARADQVLHGERGRATQMNLGARHSRGEILLFLHADTRLPRGFAGAIQGAIRSGVIGGRFDAELRGSHRFLPVVAWLMNHRSRWSRIYTGDQAIFVRREVFERIGGFPSIPLMEDIALSARLRRQGSTAALRERVSTSARRWEQAGLARTIVLMWWLRLAYACGISPARLARIYAERR